jgi:flagellar biosynthesis protein FlhF
MKIQKFIAPSLRDALSQVKSEFGKDAIVLSTKQLPQGGIEVTAASDEAEESTQQKTALRGVFAPQAPQATQQLSSPTPQNSLSEMDVERVMAPIRSELRSLRSTLKMVAEGQLDVGLKNEIALLRKTITSLREPQEEVKKDQSQELIALASKHNIAVPSQKKCIMFIGPTGVGKTTTLAKLAAREALVRGRTVALLTLDRHRVGGLEQIRTFSHLIGVPLTIVPEPSKLRTTLQDLFAFDRLYVDTAGHSHRDTAAIQALIPAVADRTDLEVHLVLPAFTSAARIDLFIKAYAPLEPEKILFTKLDEGEDLSELIRAPARLGKPISHLSTGQRVPEDLEDATVEKLISLATKGFSLEEAHDNAR